MDTLTLLCLIATAFIASSINAIAGGGGLITLPALMLAGLDPVAALATNKLQGTISNSTSALTYVARGVINLKDARPMIFFGLLGGASGALSVHLIPKQWLVTIVPILLVCVSIYFIIPRKPPSDHQKKHPLLPYRYAPLLIAPFFGFYDGIFGPGTGPFIMVALMSLCHLPLIHAMGLSRITNAASNFSALMIFIVQGYANWTVGLLMMIGAISGAYIGTRCAIYFGPKLIRPLLVMASLGLAIALLWQDTHPIRIWLSQIGLY